MNKALAVAAASAAAAVLALPWLLGARAQAVHEGFLASVQAHGARVIESRYRRGWLSSEASVKIKPPAGSLLSLPVDEAAISLDSRISHGPWPLASPRLLPSKALIESRVRLLLLGVELPTLLLTTWVGLDDSVSTEIRLPAVSSPRADSGLAPGAPGMTAEMVPGMPTEEGSILGRLSLAGQGLSSQTPGRPDAWIEDLAGEGELRLPRPLVLRLLEDRERGQATQRPRRQGRQAPAQPVALDAEIAAFDAEVAAKARRRLAFLVRRRWLVESPHFLSARAKLSDALLTINGKTIPVGAVPAP